MNVEDYRYATMMYAQTVLRDVIGGVELDDLLAKRDEVAENIRKIVDEITDQWGIDVTGARLQDIEIPEEMRRAMTRQAEAERERRAAKLIAKAPEALHLRTLHTLAEISTDQNQKVVILLPIEIMKAFLKKERK